MHEVKIELRLILGLLNLKFYRPQNEEVVSAFKGGETQRVTNALAASNQNYSNKFYLCKNVVLSVGIPEAP